MENELRPDTQLGANVASDPDSLVDISKRAFLRAAGLLVAGQMLPYVRAMEIPQASTGSDQKVVVLIVGGVRRAENLFA